MPSPIERAIEAAGGLTQLSRRLGDVTLPGVAKWRRNGVPLERCAAVEVATNGQVRCEELRNDVQWLRDEAGTVTGYVVPVAAHPEPSARVA